MKPNPRVCRTVLASASASLCLAFSAPGETLPARDYAPVFDRLWATVNDKFFDPRMNGVDWRAVRARYRPQVAGVRTDDDFHQLATRMLGELKVSHLRLNKPGAAVSAKAPPQGWGYPPTTGVTLDGAYYVRALRPGGAGADFRPGDRLLSPPAPGSAGAQGVVEVEGCDGVRRSVRFTYTPREPIYSWRVLTSPGGERIGYFRLDRFGGENAIEAIDKAMPALADTDGLIIDVRANSGGDSSALHLVNWFAEGSRPAMIIWSRGALARLGRMPTPEEVLSSRKVLGGARFINVVKGMLFGGGRAAAWTEGRGEGGYRKPVSVLIGPRTGSAGEAFAWGMKLLTPARLIGRTTAGALLSEEKFDLVDDWTVTLPNYAGWGPDGQSYIDRPVTPHELAPTTRADLCAARDPDMEAAFRHQAGAN